MIEKMIDVFELVTDRIVLTATATSAYEAYIKGDFKPSESVTMYNDHMDMLFKYQGLDGSSEKMIQNILEKHKTCTTLWFYVCSW